jgi:hypothetical protein
MVSSKLFSYELEVAMFYLKIKSNTDIVWKAIRTGNRGRVTANSHVPSSSCR